jgi:hypothetical protein
MINILVYIRVIGKVLQSVFRRCAAQRTGRFCLPPRHDVTMLTWMSAGWRPLVTLPTKTGLS